MQDEYYYSGSGFYEESDASNLNASFTDVSDVPCSLDGYSSKRARRYGQWWTLTGVAPDCQHPADAQRRLRQLYAQVVTLNHPNITRAVAMVQTPLFADECVIEEYIDGMTLGEFMQSRPDKATCHRLLEQIVDALQYSHHKGVIHGNLSPASVIVTHQDNIAKLVAYSCEGDPKDDIAALGDIIDTLGLHALKSVADDCKGGRIASIDEIRKSITGGKSQKWLKMASFALILTMFVAGAFWTGHKVAMHRDSQQADSLPLPGIYFSDTVTLRAVPDNNPLVSSVTGAIIYQNLNVHPGDIDEDLAVDLGLSVLWAPFNMGCADANINHVGNLYTWCDTVGLGGYLSIDEIWSKNRPMTDIAGSKLDASRRIWNGGWRMPTHEEWRELLDKCKWSLIKQRGIPMGYKVHGPSGAEIFFPMAGYKLRFRNYDTGLVGHYWSSTPVQEGDRQAYATRMDSIAISIDDTVTLNHNFSIRPVLDKKK